MGHALGDSLEPGMPAPRRAPPPGFVFPHQSFPRGRQHDDVNPGACGAPLVRFYTESPPARCGPSMDTGGRAYPMA